MAWTTRAERFSKSVRIADTPDDVGPGSYATTAARDVETSCAPFGSTNPRDSRDRDIAGSSLAERKPRVEESVPPPGAYDPKLPKAYDAGLPRKHVPFSCGASRSGPAPKDLGPGPGEYQRQARVEILAARTMGAPQPEKRAVIKCASAPSIPSSHAAFFYEEVGDGRLVRQAPRDGPSGFSGAVGDTAGPGHYNAHSVSSHLPRASGGKWGSGPARDKERSAELPGPGHYTAPSTTRSQPIYSSFASTSRSRSEPVKKKKAKDSTPGPGQYYKEFRAQSMRELVPEMQYFGSTSERFKPDALGLDGPGPGAYVARQRVVLKSDWSGTQRFAQGKESGQGPGPGDYNASYANGSSTSLLASTGRLAFGTMESKRGFAGNGGSVPGPGAYDQAGHAGGEREEERVRRTFKPPSSIFKTATSQAAKERVRQESSGPPPGAYSPMHPSEVSSVTRIPRKGEGFLSAGGRGTETRPVEAPGPGSYNGNPHDVTCGKRAGTFNRVVFEGAPASGRPRGLGFESQAKRFSQDPLKTKMPGPGSYTVPQDWVKKNFNTLFGEV